MLTIISRDGVILMLNDIVTKTNQEYVMNTSISQGPRQYVNNSYNVVFKTRTLWCPVLQ